ncbi:hypothetical protein MHU86_24390 [Fragilaria crotonensis]|nr:hypothetical protein MHU86_24390 [Fragilaria crotonensis]
MLRKTISNASLQRKCCLSLSSEPRLPFRLSQVEGEPGSAAIAAEGVWDGKKIPNASMVNPHVIFPWRHDTELLPRLVVGSDEFKLHGGYYGPGDPFNCPIRNMPLFTTFAANLIGVPWYKIPFSGWRQELADSSSWAFTQAVAAMMSNLYRVPFGDIRREEGDIEVDFKHTITTSNTDTEKSVNESETFSSPDLEYGRGKTSELVQKRSCVGSRSNTNPSSDADHVRPATKFDDDTLVHAKGVETTTIHNGSCHQMVDGSGVHAPLGVRCEGAIQVASIRRICRI